MKLLGPIAILTGGGDWPGLNAVMRSIAKPAISHFGAAVIGILGGFEGLVEGRMPELAPKDIGGIADLAERFSVLQAKEIRFTFLWRRLMESTSSIAPRMRFAVAGTGICMR